MTFQLNDNKFKSKKIIVKQYRSQETIITYILTLFIIIRTLQN